MGWRRLARVVLIVGGLVGGGALYWNNESGFAALWILFCAGCVYAVNPEYDEPDAFRRAVLRQSLGFGAAGLAAIAVGVLTYADVVAWKNPALLFIFGALSLDICRRGVREAKRMKADERQPISQ